MRHRWRHLLTLPFHWWSNRALPWLGVAWRGVHVPPVGAVDVDNALFIYALAMHPDHRRRVPGPSPQPPDNNPTPPSTS